MYHLNNCCCHSRKYLLTTSLHILYKCEIARFLTRNPVFIYVYSTFALVQFVPVLHQNWYRLYHLHCIQLKLKDFSFLRKIDFQDAAPGEQEEYHHRRSTFLLSHVCLQLHTNNRRRRKEDTQSFI